MSEEKKKLVFLITSTITLSLGTIFLNNEVVSGSLSIIGMMMFIIAERKISNKKDYFIFLMFLWLGLSIRFSSLFRFSFLGFLLVVFVMLIFTVIIGLLVLLDKFFEKKKLKILNVISFPVFYTLLMMALAKFSVGNNLNLMTYLMCIKGLGQNISWLGEFGMTFVFSIVINMLTYVFISKEVRVKRICLITSLVIVASLFISGNVLLKKEREPDYKLKVALATSIEMDFYGESINDLSVNDSIKVFEESVKKAVNENADLLVFPEESFILDENNNEEVISEFQRIIKKYGVPVILGVELQYEDELDINEAFFFDSDGEILMAYIKSNLIPIIEAGFFLDGDKDAGVITYNFNGHEVNLSFVICFDVNNSFYINRLPDDIELLVVPSWDWDDCNIEQKRTRIRSIEKDTTILKHSYNGFSYVSTPFGLDNDYLDFRNNYEAFEMIEVPIYEKN